VQALSDDGLKFLGRTHSVYDALKAMELGREVFPKFSVDLMYARPNQNWDNWKAEVDRALSFGVKHISLYQLAIEEGTIFYKKNIKPLDDERSASLYEQTINYLRERGLDRYEVSNFAVSSEHESIHNLVYWQGGDYIGIGEGAHGRFIADGVIKASVDGRVTEILSSEQRAEELVIMGLRIRDGINRKAFFEACGLNLFDFLSKNKTKKLAELNLLCYDDDNIKLTDKGFLVLDQIILELLS
jgi:oxygen-independent coproporphyrinogen-3 oxidase